MLYSDEQWDEKVDVQVLKTYLKMAIDAKSERMFRASLQLICEFLQEGGYLAEITKQPKEKQK